MLDYILLVIIFWGGCGGLVYAFLMISILAPSHYANAAEKAESSLKRVRATIIYIAGFFIWPVVLVGLAIWGVICFYHWIKNSIDKAVNPQPEYSYKTNPQDKVELNAKQKLLLLVGLTSPRR